MSQSTEPSVCAILLTANRPAMARQAVENFKKQTAAMERAGLKNFRLFILDTSEECPDELLDKDTNVLHVYRPIGGLTIGQLRNAAIENAVVYWEKGDGPNILIHWDDDDYSHPNRIAEQVALLQLSGADVVGYREMLFWREPAGEAWLYANNDRAGYAVGTSLCYWRRTWERKPFEATSRGEDNAFLKGLNLACVSSSIEDLRWGPPKPSLDDLKPRMVARIHGGNTSENYAPSILEQSTNWKRVPEWDSYCGEVFNAEA